MIRQVPYKVGSHVRVRSAPSGDKLPAGLPENAEVVVTALTADGGEVEFKGRKFDVCRTQIYSGFESSDGPPKEAR